MCRAQGLAADGSTNAALRRNDMTTRLQTSIRARPGNNGQEDHAFLLARVPGALFNHKRVENRTAVCEASVKQIQTKTARTPLTSSSLDRMNEEAPRTWKGIWQLLHRNRSLSLSLSLSFARSLFLFKQKESLHGTTGEGASSRSVCQCLRQSHRFV